MTHFLQKFLERSSFLLLAIFILSSLNKCKAIKILRLALKLTWIDKYALFPFDIRSILVVDYYRSANRFHPDIRPRILYGISFTRTHYIDNRCISREYPVRGKKSRRKSRHIYYENFLSLQTVCCVGLLYHAWTTHCNNFSNGLNSRKRVFFLET